MTPDEHAAVDIDLLGDYIGGALDGADEAAVARLIADDPRWRETYDLLAPGMIEVGAGLQALGAQPEPMPADVVARLEAALATPTAAAEPTTAITEPTVIDPTLAAPPEPHLTPVREGQRHLHVVPGSGSDRAPRRRSRRLRWAAPIAAAAGVLAFAGVGIDHLIGTSEDATQSAGSSADQAAPMMESQSLVTPPPKNGIVSSGIDYTGTTLGGAPGVAMADPQAPARNNRTPATTAGEFGIDPLARLRVREALIACLEAIARERGGTPIAVQRVDYARFQGAPAVVVRFTADGADWAWAAGPDCGAPDRGASPLETRQVG